MKMRFASIQYQSNFSSEIIKYEHLLDPQLFFNMETNPYYFLILLSKIHSVLFCIPV